MHADERCIAVIRVQLPLMRKLISGCTVRIGLIIVMIAPNSVSGSALMIRVPKIFPCCITRKFNV